MAGLVAVGYGSLCVVCLVAGVGVLRLAFRNHEVSEWALGLVLVLTGGVGYPLFFLRSLTVLPTGVREGSFAAGLLALSLGSVALYLYVWRVYRPGGLWPALFALAGTFVIAWSFLAEVLTVGFVADRHPLWLALGGSARMLPFGWGGLEALGVWRALRRSGHPREAERFLLWGIGLLLVLTIYAVGLTSSMRHDGTSHSPLVVGVAALCGLPAAAAIWLSFHPPAFLRRRVSSAL